MSSDITVCNKVYHQKSTQQAIRRPDQVKNCLAAESKMQQCEILPETCFKV